MNTGKPINPPPWESFEPGAHPAFILPDKKEMERLALKAIQEAREFVGGPANQFASPEMKFLADAERRRAHHEANINVTQGDDQAQHIRWWVEALIDLGRFDEARFYDFDGNAEQIALACQRPDDEDCGCERENATLAQDGTIAESGHEIELDRHFERKFQFDPYRGKVVRLFECRHCGTLNAMENPPARQAGRDVAQRQIDAHTRAAIARGERPTIQAGDAVFLKAS